MGDKIPLPDVNGEVLCGIHPVQAALHAGKRQPYTAFFMVGLSNERLDLLREQCVEKQVQIIDVKGYVLDNLSGNHPHQGVCLDVSKYKTPHICLDTDITSEKLYSSDGKPNVWLLPFHIKDTMNMGAVLRSSYYLGVNKVLLPSRYSSALNPVVSKASAGALEVMNIQSLKHDTLLEKCLVKWRDNGGIVVGSTGNEGHRKALHLHQFTVDKPTLLIIGNEAEGISENIMELCDVLLNIKNYQPELQHLNNFCVDSLNVSVATGILLHYIMMSKHGH